MWAALFFFGGGGGCVAGGWVGGLFTVVFVERPNMLFVFLLLRGDGWSFLECGWLIFWTAVQKAVQFNLDVCFVGLVRFPFHPLKGKL